MTKRCFAAVRGLVCMLSGTGMVAIAPGETEAPSRMDKLIQDITASLAELGVSVDAHGRLTTQPPPRRAACSVADYAAHVATGTWSEATTEGSSSVTAELWTGAIQAALNENQTVFIPYRDQPYYIDAPLILRSGHHLIVDPKAEIRLKPDTGTCMVRNRHQVDGQDGPVGLDDAPDTDLIIEGGIWTTLAVSRTESNGNLTGLPGAGSTLRGHGVILMGHAKRVQVRNVTIKECKPHGVQLSNVSEFLVEGVRFINHHRDGVHVNGPAHYGAIRDIRGVTGDDMVALNAWDWKNTVMTFGPISHILVEQVHAGVPGSDYRGEIRLLGGTKHFPDGKTVDCDVEECVVRDISGVRVVKMYDQPNLELGRDNDFADPIGSFRDLFFDRITIDAPAESFFQVGSNVDGLTITDVVLAFPNPPDTFKLVRIGPMSTTYKFDQSDPDTWVEVFSPDKDCTVRRLHISDVRQRQIVDGMAVEMQVPVSDHVEVATLQPNPDYPATTPKGGTGRGVLIR